jgi:GxxExxY protein
MVNTEIELLHKELSYKLVGLAFEVFNILGPGHIEKYYQNGFEELLNREKISFKKQLYVPLEFNNKVIGKNFVDLIIEDTVIIEFKVGERFTKFHFEQTTHYLKHTSKQLGLLILFAPKGVLYKRVLNIYPKS